MMHQLYWVSWHS